MSNFSWIYSHYFKKNILSPANLLVIGLPIVFLTTFTFLERFVHDIAAGELALFAGIAIPLVLGFQFFGADLTTDWLHSDLKSSTRSRLLVSPIDQRVFFISVVAAGLTTNVLYGSVVVAFTALIFGVDWGNYGLILAIMLCLTLITQLVGVIIFYFTKDKKSGNRMAYLFGEIMIGFAILPTIAVNAFSPGGILYMIFDYLPIPLAMRIVDGSNIISGFAILLSISAVLAAVVFIIGRRRDDGI